jgi:hypothetical protein
LVKVSLARKPLWKQQEVLDWHEPTTYQKLGVVA